MLCSDVPIEPSPTFTLRSSCDTSQNTGMNPFTLALLPADGPIVRQAAIVTLLTIGTGRAGYNFHAELNLVLKVILSD